MGVALGECQGHGETGAGAAAAVATGKGGRGEGGVGKGWCHTRGWVVRKHGKKKKMVEKKEGESVRNKEVGRKKNIRGSGSCA